MPLELLVPVLLELLVAVLLRVAALVEEELPVCDELGVPV